jgi:hypothetical protein
MIKKSWIVLFILNLLVFTFFSFRMGSIVFILNFLYILWQIGLFTSIKFSRGNFNECELYFFEYVGEYHNVGKEFEKLSLIMKKLNASKSTFVPFGIYYDDPKRVDPKSCRALIGILKRIVEGRERHEELVDYLTENSFKKATVPSTISLYSNFPLVNIMSMVIGIKKFYNALHTNFQNDQWKNQYGIKEQIIPCSIEIYGEHLMEFYVPLTNYERFNLHTIKRN